MNHKVRPWAYRIWTNETRQPLVTQTPKDGNGLEALIKENGEFVTAVAWSLYVHADPPLYHLEPVKHVDEFITKKGNKWVSEKEDESAITKFPLSSFLKVPDGFVVMAEDSITRYLDAIEDYRSDPKGKEPIRMYNYPGVQDAESAMAGQSREQQIEQMLESADREYQEKKSGPKQS